MSNYLFVCTDVANNVWVPLTPAMLGGGGGGGGGAAGGGTSDTTEATQLAVKVAVQSIEGKTPALSGGAVPVVAAALPLPAGAASAANQATANAALGAPADAAASSDTGAFSLTALIKRLLAGVTSILTNQSQRVWSPVIGSTVSLALTGTTSAAIAVTAAETMRFSNAGASVLSVTFGTSGGVTAVASTSIDIMPGTSEAIRVPATATHFAAIGSGTLKYTRGVGA